MTQGGRKWNFRKPRINSEPMRRTRRNSSMRRPGPSRKRRSAVDRLAFPHWQNSGGCFGISALRNTNNHAAENNKPCRGEQEIWCREECPEGRALDHRLRAEREILGIRHYARATVRRRIIPRAPIPRRLSVAGDITHRNARSAAEVSLLHPELLRCFSGLKLKERHLANPVRDSDGRVE